jgi:outer membrane protein TolC
MPAPESTSPLLSALVLAVALARSSFAAELPGHDDEPLDMDPSLSLEMAVDLTLAAFPDFEILAARKAEADAWTARGGSLLANRPSIILRYQTDRWGSDDNLTEYEAGVTLPLWGWGGRSAVQGLGDALSTESVAATAALRWQVGGFVRDALWNVALATNDQRLAAEARDTSLRLVQVVERRHELGDVALSDVLLARSSYLGLQTALIAADAALLDAERAYRSVTSLDRRPDFVPEALSDMNEITPHHPALAFANAAVERAEANVDVMEQTANSGSSVMIGTRHERPAFGTDLDDSIGIILSIPFGGGSHRNIQISEAARAASAARADRNRQIRALTLALHEAAHGLNVVHENLEMAAERLALAERHEAMGEMAYEKGEIELMDLLRIQATTIEARQLATRLEIEEKRQTALYNQAVGELL